MVGVAMLPTVPETARFLGNLDVTTSTSAQASRKRKQSHYMLVGVKGFMYRQCVRACMSVLYEGGGQVQGRHVRERYSRPPLAYLECSVPVDSAAHGGDSGD